MQLIKQVSSNFNDPDSVLAQTIAADSGWSMNDAGHIFDHAGTILAPSFTALGSYMRICGWFTPEDARATGVHWSEVPDIRDERSTAVRAASRGSAV